MMTITSSSSSVGEGQPGKLIESTNDFSKETKAKLLGENALQFLGLSKEKFLPDVDH